MLVRNFTKHFKPIPLYNQQKYFLLDHKKMEKEKEKLFGDKERTMMLKAKFIWR